MSRVLAHILRKEQNDAKERVLALRLQAEAWRILALIALHEPAYAVGKARWLMFMSVPFVNGVEVQRFIDEHRERARAAGKATGVFSQ